MARGLLTLTMVAMDMAAMDTARGLLMPTTGATAMAVTAMASNFIHQENPAPKRHISKSKFLQFTLDLSNLYLGGYGYGKRSADAYYGGYGYGGYGYRKRSADAEAYYGGYGYGGYGYGKRSADAYYGGYGYGGYGYGKRSADAEAYYGGYGYGGYGY